MSNEVVDFNKLGKKRRPIEIMDDEKTSDGVGKFMIYNPYSTVRVLCKDGEVRKISIHEDQLKKLCASLERRKKKDLDSK